MRRGLVLGVLFLALTLPSKGMTLEEFLKKPNAYWQEGVKEFVGLAATKVNGLKLEVEPPGAGRLELFTQIAGSYNLSVKEVEELYSRAVKIAVEDALKHFNCRVSDPDIGFVFGDITGQIRWSCREKIEEFIRKRAKDYLREAIIECNLLKLSPTVSSFLESSQCKELLREFPKVATRTLFQYLREREREIYNHPERLKGEPLKEIVTTLKRSGLL